MKLNDEIIHKAVHGDKTAINQILEFFDGYINMLSSDEIADENGEAFTTMNEDIKSILQLKLTETIRKWRAVL